MIKKLILGILFSMPLSAFAADSQNVDTKSFAGSDANINQNFEAGKPQAQTPQFGINSAGSAVPLFTQATRSADQLYEAYERVQELLNISISDEYLTDQMLSEMEVGIRQERELAFVSFSPKEGFIRNKTSLSDRERGENEALLLPRFTKTLTIKGEYLGLLYVTSRQGVPTTDQDMRNAVIAFTSENISLYFPSKKIYLVDVPEGVGINVGVSTESTAKGLFASIGALFGGTSSGALGVSYTKNDGDTRYTTTIGRQILVFVDNGLVPININFNPQQAPKPKQTETKQEIITPIIKQDVPTIIKDTGVSLKITVEPKTNATPYKILD